MVSSKINLKQWQKYLPCFYHWDKGENRQKKTAVLAHLFSGASSLKSPLCLVISIYEQNSYVKKKY